jgi:glycosyltransferase involved in cell wall biosynthesis
VNGQSGDVLAIRKRGNRERILFVSYPLLPVSRESAGGAEQVLATVEREASRAGWTTTVAACEGSIAAGQVYSTGLPGRGRHDGASRFESRHCKRVLELISVRSAVGTPFDIVHDHSGSFFCHADNIDVPVLATLHLPRSFYPANAFHRLPENVYFNCVSKAQARTFADLPNMLGVVPNGIPLDSFPLHSRKQDYLLWIGRICEEKGTHTALDLAKKAGMNVVIAGQVYPFAYHQDYFDHQIRPRLEQMGAQAKFIDSPSFAQKVDLLQNACSLIVTSTADETSCLVAMEAAACGTPVVGLRRGALSEVIAHRITGYVVNDISQMAGALPELRNIRPRTCREYAQQYFSASRMYAGYEALYEQLRRKPVHVLEVLAA